jgi:N,N'-diacetyllegionaminate synthase
MNRVYIIAEAGVNHNGSLETAKKLVDIAVDVGVDAVKFQMFKAENLVGKSAPKAKYQELGTCTNESQLEMLKKLELCEKSFLELDEYCRTRDIQFISTAFDHDSIDFLDDLGVPFFKIPSGEITNIPYLRHIGKLGKSVIMSTGMATLGEIETTLLVLQDAGMPREKITLLHCCTEYPTPFEDVNLMAMKTFSVAFPGVNVGYSDHTLGIEVPVAAVAMGASVIEKHFTLDKTMDGPDHQASLEPKELQAMVEAIRNIEKAIGNGEKRPSSSEEKNLPIARRSIVASVQILKGDVFTERNLTAKRPGIGISPSYWDDVIGKTASRDFSEDELIELC